jgi:hypothetical protein
MIILYSPLTLKEEQMGPSNDLLMLEIETGVIGASIIIAGVFVSLAVRAASIRIVKAIIKKHEA